MNVIKVKFDIDIDNEQQLNAFNSFISTLKSVGGTQAVVQAPVKDIKAKAEPAATTAATTTTPVAGNTAGESANGTPSTGSKKLDEIRKLIAEKVASNRAEIKAKLTELGTDTATNLSVDKYEEFHTYLSSLV